MPVEINGGLVLADGVRIGGGVPKCGCECDTPCQQCAGCCHALDSKVTVTLNEEWNPGTGAWASWDDAWLTDIPRVPPPNNPGNTWKRTVGGFTITVIYACSPFLSAVWLLQIIGPTGFVFGNLNSAGNASDPVNDGFRGWGVMGQSPLTELDDIYPSADCCRSLTDFRVAVGRPSMGNVIWLAGVASLLYSPPRPITGTFTVTAADGSSVPACQPIITRVDKYTWTAVKNCETGAIALTGPVAVLDQSGIVTVANPPPWTGTGTLCQWTVTIAVPKDAPPPDAPPTDSLNCCPEVCVDTYTVERTQACPGGAFTVGTPVVTTNTAGSIGDTGWIPAGKCRDIRQKSVACGSAPPTFDEPDDKDCCSDPTPTRMVDRYRWHVTRNCETKTNTVTRIDEINVVGTVHDTGFVRSGECEWVRSAAVPHGAAVPSEAAAGLVCCNDDDGPGDGTEDPGGGGDGPIPLIRCKTGVADNTKTIDPTGISDGRTVLINDECYRVDLSVDRLTGEPTIPDLDVYEEFDDCEACAPDCCEVRAFTGKFHSSRSKIAGFSYLYTYRERYIDFDGVTEVVGPILYGVRVPSGGGTTDVLKDPTGCGRFLKESVGYETFDGTSWTSAGTATIDLEINSVFGVIDHPGAGWIIRIYIPFVGYVSYTDFSGGNTGMYWTNTPTVNKTAVYCDPYEDVDRTIDSMLYTEDEYDGMGEPTGRVRTHYSREKLVVTGNLVNPDCDCE